MERLTVEAVAKRLHKNPQVLREYIKAGLLPFAVAHKSEGSSQWNYIIFPAKFEEYCAVGGKPDTSRLKEVMQDA